MRSGGVSWCRLFAEQARLARRVTQLVRDADDDADWRAAGCSSSAQWLAQVSSSDHRNAVRITQTSEALRSLPALDHALGTGALTLDQVAAAAEYATPENDAELARVALGKPPSAIGVGGPHARPAQSRGRPSALPAAGVEHDVDAWTARAVSERPPAARAGRDRSSRRSGTSRSSSAPLTSRPARSWTGSSRPPTRSSHSPRVAKAAVCGVARRH